jgi:hypothetical protein
MINQYWHKITLLTTVPVLRHDTAMDVNDNSNSWKDPDEVAKSGRVRSGKARMEKLTHEQRVELGRLAAQKRWSASPTHKASHLGILQIGDSEIPCAVLEDGTRVVSERGLVKSFGGKRGGYYWRQKKANPDGALLTPVLAANNLKPFISPELQSALSERFIYTGGQGAPGHGLRAELYPKICEVYLKARDAGVLTASQQDMAKAADVLMRALAHTAIAALVDEATGYQYERPRDALQKILEAFIAKELRPYVHTFKDDFYENLFRLRGLNYPIDSVKRPQYFGHLTNNIVYARLAPKVLEELKKATPRKPDGRLKHHLHRRLTEEIGHPKLREHLASVTSLMKISSTYEQFEKFLDTAHPKYTENMVLPFDGEVPEEGI